jgi:tetratricopeptide (TPR) repeat protein
MSANSINIENLLMLAKDAESLGKYEEAYEYYSRCLEHDSKNAIAWVGKGNTTKWTIGDKINISKTEAYIDYLKTCFDNALTFTDNKEEIRKKIIEVLESKIGISYSGIQCANLLLKYDPDNVKALLTMGDDSLTEYTKITETIPFKPINILESIKYYKKALQSSKNDEETKNKIIGAITYHIYKVRFNAINFFFSRNKLKRLFDPHNSMSYCKLFDFLDELGETDETINFKKLFIKRLLFNLRDDKNASALREIYINQIKAYDSSYKTPKCFIATATYGSPAAYEVIFLREFRDRYLENTQCGKMFVKAYYFLSPPIARLIGRSKLLRATTKKLLNLIIYSI